MCRTCMAMSPVQMTSCDFGDMKFGRLTVRRPALNMRDMRFVFVNSAAYTTVKQKPTPNLETRTVCGATDKQISYYYFLRSVGCC